MTLPRYLTIDDDDQLVQQPFGDYQSLRGDYISLENIVLESPDKEVVLAGVEGKELELSLEFAPGTPSIELDVLRSPDKKEFTRIIFYRNGGYPDRFYPNQNNRSSALSIDTSMGSIHPDTMRHIPETVHVYLGKEEALKLHVFIDRSIVEVFVNDRQATMLRTWPVLPESTTVSVRTLAGPTSVIKAEAWKMRPINPSIME
jgi:beta-fructofuranosidase